MRLTNHRVGRAGPVEIRVGKTQRRADFGVYRVAFQGKTNGVKTSGCGCTGFCHAKYSGRFIRLRTEMCVFTELPWCNLMSACTSSRPGKNPSC